MLMEQQRIREALSLDVFFQSLLQIAGDVESDEDDDEEECVSSYLSSQQRLPPFCFAEVDKSRQWIKDLLLEDSSESEEEDINEMLKLHKATLHYRDQFHSDPMLSKFMHYSSDLITGKNKWPAHRLAVKKKCMKRKRKSKQSSPQDQQTSSNASSAVALRNLSHFNGKMLGDGAKKRALSLSRKRSTSAAAVRKHVWKIIIKKEIPKAYRQHMQNQSTKLALLKKASKDASKKVRAKAHDSRFRAKKETIIGRARRMTREAQLFWKKYVRVEKTQRKHAEKQALVQQRIDDAMRETLKQQQKLKFLITQTELYAHFVSGNLTLQEASKVTTLDTSVVEDPMKEEILSHLDHTTDADDLLDSGYTREKALGNANIAFQRHKSKMDMFSNAESLFKDQTPEEIQTKTTASSYEQPFTCYIEVLYLQSSLRAPDVNQSAAQPKMLQGQLTGYQLVGVNWMFNLYLHGLNGILADDMGLGKTVQTIAFLAGLAERYDVWGPFLVIAPASTLNNWHQEFSRFLPSFKILPYWGSTSERKVLRLFWNQKGEVKPDASAPFHVLITSYQLATTDVRYFQRIQWHYIVFDEAHALKSSNSIRWRTLLDFNCRNRLLLTGTPIQNTMAELWALLHFIMPTLFDNHAEFNEWFSKNIENYIESKSSIDQTTLIKSVVLTDETSEIQKLVIIFNIRRLPTGDLSRLHMILKPFILRRLKCDVEHELTEKVEVRVLCQLSPRQKILYDALQRNVLIKELLRQNSTGQSTNNIVLMNLVMQFRKVCNHPDIFHSRDISSSYCFKTSPYLLPRLIYDSFFSPTSTRKKSCKFFYSDLNIHSPHNVQRSLAKSGTEVSSFSFLPFMNLSPGEYWRVFVGNIGERCQQIAKIADGRRQRIHSLLFRNIQSAHCHFKTRQTYTKHQHAEKSNRFDDNSRLNFLLSTFLDLNKYSSRQPSVLSPLLFVECFPNVIGHFNHTITCVSETKNVMTCHITSTNDEQHQSDVPASTTTTKKSPVGSNRHRITVAVKTNEVTEMASAFKGLYFPKAFSIPHEIYCNDQSALHQFTREGRDLKERVQFDQNIRFPVPVFVPDRERLVSDSGKLQALDMLLRRLKDGGHRVLIYSQMTKMIDILEEYMLMRRHMYVRLDGSSRISSRRDTVAGFQSCESIFAFLLSTRAGGLGINLTAADTVIFYDSDWNPTVDQQAMDRAHRLGQTKQVTVYRLVCKGTVDERMLARAEAKSVIQRMVIQDGYFKTDSLNQTEMVSLLLDDDQIANAAQKDVNLKNSFETAKLTGKIKYRRNLSKDGRGRKRVKKRVVEGNISKTELKALKLTPQVINISSKCSSASSDASSSANTSDSKNSQSVDEQVIVVDDSNSEPVQSESTVVRGRRKRGRPRIRPILEGRSRLLSRTPIQRRWPGVSRRGRGARAGRRGRPFSGRAAAMAGARAGAMAASVATFLSHADSSSNTNT